MGFDATSQLLIIYCAFIKYLKKEKRGGGGYSEAVDHLFKTSIKRNVLTIKQNTSGSRLG